MITSDTYIISDTHFGHKNIVRYCSRPLNHEEVILHNWKMEVGANDEVLHLGDVMFAQVDDWVDALKDMPGRMKLIKGNHDHSKTVKKMKKEVGVEVIKPFVQRFGDFNFLFSHHPGERVEEDWDINIHGHIHNNPLNFEYPRKLDETKLYINVSVEVMAYRPVKLSTIFERIGRVI